MSGERSRFVVSADWVEKNLGSPGFKLVDASWYLPAQGRNGAVEYASGHIPGAVFFDQDVIADTTTDLPHSMPSPAFTSRAAPAGVPPAGPPGRFPVPGPRVPVPAESGNGDSLPVSRPNRESGERELGISGSEPQANRGPSPWLTSAASRGGWPGPPAP